MRIAARVYSTQHPGWLHPSGEVREDDMRHWFSSLVSVRRAVAAFIALSSPSMLNDGFGTIVVAQYEREVWREVAYKDEVVIKHLVVYRSRPKITKAQSIREQEES